MSSISSHRVYMWPCHPSAQISCIMETSTPPAIKGGDNKFPTHQHTQSHIYYTKADRELNSSGIFCRLTDPWRTCKEKKKFTGKLVKTQRVGLEIKLCGSESTLFLQRPECSSHHPIWATHNCQQPQLQRDLMPTSEFCGHLHSHVHKPVCRFIKIQMH